MATGWPPLASSPPGCRRRSSLGQLEDLSVQPLPIHVVTHGSQLPVAFRDPSPSNPVVIGFDCEGVDLACRGRLCIMQLAWEKEVYLVDAVVGGERLMEECRKGLESPYVTKVVHDCKRDSEALYFQYGIKLQGVFDTQIAFSMIEELEGRPKRVDDCISFVDLLADERYCGVVYDEKQEVRDIMRKDKEFWVHRPWTPMMERVASDDVRFLFRIYSQMKARLEVQPWALNLLALRSSLYCRCFCVGATDWPRPLSPPGDKDGVAPGLEEEVLSVVDVPMGMMGLIIGKKGATIRAIKEDCKRAEIIIGGVKGPNNKVFVIGPLKEVRKAEAIIRGKIM